MDRTGHRSIPPAAACNRTRSLAVRHRRRPLPPRRRSPLPPRPPAQTRRRRPHRLAPALRPTALRPPPPPPRQPPRRRNPLTRRQHVDSRRRYPRRSAPPLRGPHDRPIRLQPERLGKRQGPRRSLARNPLAPQARRPAIPDVHRGLCGRRRFAKPAKGTTHARKLGYQRAHGYSIVCTWNAFRRHGRVVLYAAPGRHSCTRRSIELARIRLRHSGAAYRVAS